MKKQKAILGITAFNHDSSACLVYNDKIVAFSEEERFNYSKHTGDFPIQSILFCLKQAELSIQEIEYIAFYFNPARCIISYIKNNNPFSSFINPFFFKRKRFYFELIWLLSFINKINSIRRVLKNERIKINYIDHHIAHVWYGYFSSSFKNCTVLSNDSVGEDISSLAIEFRVKDNKEILAKKIISQKDPHSLGYLYGAITEFLGYKRRTDEGKVMALAALGSDKYVDYFNKSIKYLSKGQFRINDDLIVPRNFQPKAQRLSNKFFKKFGGPRKYFEVLKQNHYDIAYALQWLTEKILEHQLKYISDKNIVLTGGIAQNSVANGKINNLFPNKNIFIPPIPNDAGCSLGAAVNLYYKYYKRVPDYVDTAFLGPTFNDNEIIKILKKNKISFKKLNNPISFLSNKLSKNKVIILFRGKMECGPRALGNRSIIANPIDSKMKDHLNNDIKNREYFRPYGGLIIDKYVKEIFDYKNKSIDGPYMSFVYPVKDEWLRKIPSLVHFDKSSRIQIVKSGQDYFLERLLEDFKEKTGVPLLINTSLNLKGFPIARTPQDAINAFYNSAIDYLLFNESILISK